MTTVVFGGTGVQFSAPSSQKHPETHPCCFWCRVQACSPRCAPFNGVEHVAADDNCTSEWVSETVIVSRGGDMACLVEMWMMMLHTQGALL